MRVNPRVVLAKLYLHDISEERLENEERSKVRKVSPPVWYGFRNKASSSTSIRILILRSPLTQRSSSLHCMNTFSTTHIAGGRCCDKVSLINSQVAPNFPEVKVVVINFQSSQSNRLPFHEHSMKPLLCEHSTEHFVSFCLDSLHHFGIK